MSERQMTIVLLIVMGGILLAGAGLIYYLRYQEMASLEEELAAVQKELDEALAKKANIKKLEDEVKLKSEKIEVIRGQIPVFSPKEENDAFQDLVDALRKKSRVNVLDVRYSAVRAGQPGADLPSTIFRARYEMKVTGGFFQLLSFMNLLEAERRFLVVDNIKLLAGSVADKPGVAPVRELQMNLSTFMQRPSTVPTPQPVGKQPEKAPEPTPEERRPSTPIPD